MRSSRRSHFRTRRHTWYNLCVTFRHSRKADNSLCSQHIQAAMRQLSPHFLPSRRQGLREVFFPSRLRFPHPPDCRNNIPQYEYALLFRRSALSYNSSRCAYALLFPACHTPAPPRSDNMSRHAYAPSPNRSGFLPRRSTRHRVYALFLYR